MKSVFFYGLFMDKDLLNEKGFNPSSPTLAHIKGYGLRIGERATLVKSEGECAYGLIMSLEEEELDILYGENSVSDYIPENLTATNSNNENIHVTSYNLPLEKLTGENKEYARSLAIVARRVGLPSEYLVEIEKWTI